MFEFKSPLYWKEMRKIRKEFEEQAARNKQQADKAQATKSQAAGGKAQAPSSEGQASSHKHRDPL